MSDKTSLELALQSVSPCETVETRRDRVANRQKILERMRLKRDSMLPIEGRDAKKALNQRIKCLEEIIENPEIEEKYPRLSTDVLKWRDGGGLPKLVPFTLDNPVFEIKWSLPFYKKFYAVHFLPYDIFRRIKFKPFGSIKCLPRPMRNLYSDLHKDVDDLRYIEGIENSFSFVGRFNSISTEFKGLIPQRVHESIISATEDFKIRKIFLIGEVLSWKTRLLAHGDPLVVGYKAGCLWLICSFKEPPLEEYARREFTI